MKNLQKMLQEIISNNTSYKYDIQGLKLFIENLKIDTDILATLLQNLKDINSLTSFISFLVNGGYISSETFYFIPMNLANL